MPEAAPQLASYVRGAARQLRYLVAREEDRSFERNGGEIFYAVDTSVIVTYSDPFKDTDAVPQKKDVSTRVFPDDPPSLSVGLAYALTQFLFYELTRIGRPLVVLPALERELRIIYSAVVRNASIEEKEARKEEEALARKIQEIRAGRNHQETAIELTNQFPALERWLAGSKGAGTQLRRFGQLLSDERIAPLGYLLEEGRIESEQMRAAFGEPIGLEKIVNLINRKESWKRRLLTTKSRGTSEESIESDAAALAHVEYINANIDQGKYRFIYVTGDASALAAGEAYFPAENDVPFCELYMRHVRAYAAEGGISPDSGSNSNSDEFFGLLRIFLDEFLPRDTSTALSAQQTLKNQLGEILRWPRKKSVEQCESILARRPDLLETFCYRWREFAEAIAMQKTLGAPRASPSVFEPVLRNLHKDIVEQVHELVELRVQETWNAWLSATTEAGYGLLYKRSGRERQRTRTVPPLILNTLPEIQAFVERILEHYDQGQSDYGSYRTVIERIVASDETGYFYYLCFALLFAAEGNWQLSAILASRAIDIAEKACATSPLISGREACYLKAVALRHSARTTDELAEVAVLLDQADARLEQDKRSRKIARTGEERFEAERLSLYLTFRLYEVFLHLPVPATVPSMQELEKRMEDLLKRLDGRTDKWINRYVERDLLTNVFQVALIQVHFGQMHFDREKFEPLMIRFVRNVFDDSVPKIQTSYVVDSVFLVARTLLASNSGKRRELRKAATLHLSDKMIAEHLVMPYDRQRFELLRSMIP